MKFSLFFVVALCVFSAVAVLGQDVQPKAVVPAPVAVPATPAAGTVTACHPQCRWQCDDPSCPAQCHPVCERPKCQVHCEETPCAACKIHCDKPQCNVRCPKDLCESTDCPKCETVCAPAKCRTACTAPNAVCTPMCEETKCDWKCKKPTLCPRPKCELVCETPACAYAAPVVAAAPNNTCCACSAANVQASMLQAGEAFNGEAMSFLEVMHTMKHSSQEAGAPACCACNKQ